VKKLEAVYDEIEAAGGPQPVIFPMNLEKAGESDYQGLAEGIYQQLGRLDGILHNASRFDNLSPLEIQTTEQFTGMLQTNLVAPFALTKACLPLLKRSPDASVVVTSTTAAQKPGAFWGAHAISKSAADILVKIWAQELETFPNIRINTVIPGPVQCPQRKLSHPGELHTNLPQTDSLMPLYLYLMGQDSAGVSGQTFEAQKLREE
jgi:NAD(P)-dependent dehydrogenase (short-subunit alcohol dehydrogenase family)